MQCLSLAGNDSDRGRASAGAVSMDSAPTSLKGMACKGQQENGGFGCWPNARREGRRLRLGEKTKKETKKKKNAEELVFIDHCGWLHWEVGTTSMRLNSNWRPDPSLPVLGLVLWV